MLEIRSLTERELDAASVLPLSRYGRPGGEYLVAWRGGEPLGHAHVDWAADPPELQDVWVREDVRRGGIGTALTEAAERRAAERGHRRFALEVSERNALARRLYERLGYERTSDSPRRVRGTVQLRTGPLEVDDVLLRYAKRL